MAATAAHNLFQSSPKAYYYIFSQICTYPNTKKTAHGPKKRGRKFETTSETAFLNNCEVRVTTSLCMQRRALREAQTEREKEKRGHKKQFDLLLHSRSSNSLLIENAKPLLQEWVCTMRGMGGPYKCMFGGRELVPLLSLPSKSGILLTAPLPSPQAPAPLSFPLFLSFKESSFLSLAHCGE